MRNKLKSSIAGAALSFAASGLAFAADIALKAPPPAPVPVYNWTGWYVGVNAGASFGRAKTDFNEGPVALRENALIILPVGFAGSNTEYPDGFMGGGQIGYNWQFSPIWVAGIEADFQGEVGRSGMVPIYSLLRGLRS